MTQGMNLPTKNQDLLNEADNEVATRASLAVDFDDEIHTTIENSDQKGAKSLRESVKDLVNPKNVETKEAKKEGSGMNFAVLGSVLLFLVADVAKNVIEVKAVKGTGVNTTFALLVYSCATLVIAPLMTAYFKGTEGLKKIVEWSSLKLFVLPAIIFSLSQCFNMFVSTMLDPGTKKVFTQLRMPMTALFGRVIMGNGYTKLQWAALTCIVVSACAYNSLKDVAEGATGKQADNFVLGLVFAMCGNIFAVIGSLVAEKMLKSQKSTPFYIQKAQIEFWGLIMGVFSWAVLVPFVLTYIQDGFQYGMAHKKAHPMTRKMLFKATTTDLNREQQIAKHMKLLNEFKPVDSEFFVNKEIELAMQSKMQALKLKIVDEEYVHKEVYASARDLMKNITIKVGTAKPITLKNADDEANKGTFFAANPDKKDASKFDLFQLSEDGKVLTQTKAAQVIDEVKVTKDLLEEVMKEEATLKKRDGEEEDDDVKEGKFPVFEKRLNEFVEKVKKFNEQAKEANITDPKKILEAQEKKFAAVYGVATQTLCKCTESMLFDNESRKAKKMTCTDAEGKVVEISVFPGEFGVGSPSGKGSVVEWEWEEWTSKVFAGWTYVMVFALISFVVQSWSSGMIAKNIDSLTKNICSAVAMGLVVYTQECVTFFEKGTFNTDPRLFIGVLGVFGSSVVFVWAPKAPKKEVK